MRRNVGVTINAITLVMVILMVIPSTTGADDEGPERIHLLAGSYVTTNLTVDINMMPNVVANMGKLGSISCRCSQNRNHENAP